MALPIEVPFVDALYSQWRSSDDPHAAAAGQQAFVRNAQSSGSLLERVPEFLTFSCAGIACAVSLPTIREVLESAPMVASLPDSPGWFQGVFQLRTEILGAADMRPLLTGHADNRDDASNHGAYATLSGRERAIVVGTGVRSLALLVESIGDILSLRPHEILSDLVDHPAFGAVAPRYRLGLLSPDIHQVRFALVALDTLLIDALNALSDPEVASYE